MREAGLLLDDPDEHAAMARRGLPFGDGRAAERGAAAIRALLCDPWREDVSPGSRRDDEALA